MRGYLGSTPSPVPVPARESWELCSSSSHLWSLTTFPGYYSKSSEFGYPRRMVLRAGSDSEEWLGGYGSWAARTGKWVTRLEDALASLGPGEAPRAPRSLPLSLPALDPARAALELHPALGTAQHKGAALISQPEGSVGTLGAWENGGRKTRPKSATTEKVRESSWRTPVAGRVASRFAAPDPIVRNPMPHSQGLHARGRMAHDPRRLGSQ